MLPPANVKGVTRDERINRTDRFAVLDRRHARGVGVHSRGHTMKIINDVFWFIGVMAMGFLLLLFGQQDASAEVRIGYGANCGIARGDGFWEQQGQPFERDNCGNVAAVQYVGRTGIGWLDYSVGAAYRTGTSVKNGKWLTDKCYWELRLSSGGPGGECDGRIFTDSVESTSRALSFALIPTWRIKKDVSIYTALGATYFRADTKAVFAGGSGMFSDFPHVTNTYRNEGLSLYSELGATYGNLFLTAYLAPNEHGGEHAEKGMYGLMVGLRFK
jgi:hypothetical protein